MSDTPHPELLGDAQDAVLIQDAAAYVVDVNEEACRSLGYTRDELVGKHARDLVEGLDGDVLHRLTLLLKEQGVATVRATHHRKDGTRFPVETRLALIRRDGVPLIVAFARDLDRAHAAQRALEQSEERYRGLVELLPDGVVTYRDGRIAFANPAAAKLMRVDRPERLLGTAVLERVDPSAHAIVQERMTRVARGEQVPLMQERLIRLDGTSFHAEVTAALLGTGEVLVVFRDVTERHRAEEDRFDLEERLRQAEKIDALGTLAGGVAHDFNNVLAAILGHADALASELPANSAAREDAEQIAAAARRAKGVVHQILAFARRRPAEAILLDVGRTVREDLPLVRAATPASVEIALRADPAAGAVLADPTQIHQVLLNLCANARDAMASRGGILEISVAPVQAPESDGAPAGLAPGPYVRLSVTDTGQGMDGPTRARAFEPYFTTKPLGAGSGLGLSVVHGIVTGLGGAVTLASTAGEGTSVAVWLPRLAGPDAAAASPRPSSAAPEPAPDERPPPARHRVLVVDDDPPVARAIARMLDHAGYRVTVVEDAESALEEFQADPGAFDLVLTDQTLPRMRGDELTRALLAMRPALPILICTGYSERLDEERALAIGARALLPKPLDLRELVTALRDAIGSG
jgi:PAS domain S-box-containing protein